MSAATPQLAKAAKRRAYVPQPGTIPAKVLAYLQAQRARGREWIPGAELAEHVGNGPVSPYLTAPIEHGAIRRRPVEGNRRMSEYAVGDGKPLPKPVDFEKDPPMHDAAPPVPRPGPLFPPMVGQRPGGFHASLDTDGVLVLQIAGKKIELDASQTAALARLFAGRAVAA